MLDLGVVVDLHGVPPGLVGTGEKVSRRCVARFESMWIGNQGVKGGGRRWRPPTWSTPALMSPPSRGDR